MAFCRVEVQKLVNVRTAAERTSSSAPVTGPQVQEKAAGLLEAHAFISRTFPRLTRKMVEAVGAGPLSASTAYDVASEGRGTPFAPFNTRKLLASFTAGFSTESTLMGPPCPPFASLSQILSSYPSGAY